MLAGDPGCTAENWNGCDPNGGCNSSDVSSFAPTNLNVSAWMVSMKDLGATSAVLTAKHGCGFLGWQTNTTLPDGSPYGYQVPSQYPVLEQFVAAAREEGIGYGFYYSLTNNFFLNAADHNVRPPSTLLPGQVNVTQAQYEDLAIAQMTELWTKFGTLTEIWLDGGCGTLCPRVSALLNNSYAKDAVAFNGGGGTSLNPVRWCGTEGGSPAGVPVVWSTSNGSTCAPGVGSGCPPDSPNIQWNPSGVDFTLQQGDNWFYMPGVPVHSLSDLATVYHNSVGANGHLELDFAIDRTGGIDPAHAAMYKTFGDWIRACYGTPVGFKSVTGASTAVLTLPTAGVQVDRVELREDQTQGQLVIDYVVTYQAPGSSAWLPFSSGMTIGAKHIDVRAAGAVTATAFNLTITKGYDVPTGLSLLAFSGQGCAV